MAVSILGMICAVVLGYSAQYLKLYLKKVKTDKKRLIMFSSASALFLTLTVLSDIFALQDIFVLSWDIGFSLAMASIIYFMTYHNRETYELSEKLKAIPEVKRAAIGFSIFAVCYISFPIIGFMIYSLVSGETSFYIPNENLDAAMLIVVLYFVFFFVATFHFTKAFRKHYKAEILARTYGKEMADDTENDKNN